MGVMRVVVRVMRVIRVTMRMMPVTMMKNIPAEEVREW